MVLMNEYCNTLRNKKKPREVLGRLRLWPMHKFDISLKAFARLPLFVVVFNDAHHWQIIYIWITTAIMHNTTMIAPIDKKKERQQSQTRINTVVCLLVILLPIFTNQTIHLAQQLS